MLAAIDFRQASVLAETNTVALVGGKKTYVAWSRFNRPLAGPIIFCCFFFEATLRTTRSEEFLIFFGGKKSC